MRGGERQQAFRRDDALVHGARDNASPYSRLAAAGPSRQPGQLDGTRLQLSTKGRVALGKPAAEAIRQLLQRWLTHALVELDESPISRSRASAPQHPAPRPSRAARRSPWRWPNARCGEWIRIDDLFTAMRRGGLIPTIRRSERAL